MLSGGRHDRPVVSPPLSFVRPRDHPLEGPPGPARVLAFAALVDRLAVPPPLHRVAMHGLRAGTSPPPRRKVEARRAIERAFRSRSMGLGRRRRGREASGGADA